MERHIAIAKEALEGAPGLTSRVSFALGSADSVPAKDQAFDLVWCKDVLYHSPDLDAAYAECRRLLRDGGRMLVYQLFATERLDAAEAEWLWQTAGVVPENAKVEVTERALAGAGLKVDQRIELGSEWAEWSQEQAGKPGRKLLHAARLLRDPERYIGAFGKTAYDIKLGDCLWHVYRMIGKLSCRVYVLST